MKKLDRLNFTSIYGNLGQLHGYLNGLESKVDNEKLPITSEDIKALRDFTNKALLTLDLALGYKAKCNTCRNFYKKDEDIESIENTGECLSCDHVRSDI